MYKVYLAGKITGDENYKEKFEEVERKLIEDHPALAKAEIFNPAKMVLPDFATHEEIMTVCFMFLRKCDVVYFLPDWKESRGACMERGFANALDITIIDLDKDVD